MSFLYIDLKSAIRELWISIIEDIETRQNSGQNRVATLRRCNMTVPWVIVLVFFSWLLPETLGSLRTTSATETSLKNVTSRRLNIYHVVHFVKRWWISLELNSKAEYLSVRKSLSCVHVLKKTWNLAVSRRRCAKTARKCTKKGWKFCFANLKLLFVCLFFLFFAILVALLSSLLTLANNLQMTDGILQLTLINTKHRQSVIVFTKISTRRLGTGVWLTF